MERPGNQQTLMGKETCEAPIRVAKQISSNMARLEKLAWRLRAGPPALVVTCARGSSDHAACFAKYLIETQIGIPTLSAVPSVHSVYKVCLDMRQVLFLAISQSGKSPDILASARAAKAGGALLVSLVNETTSPLAQLSDVVIPMHAGPEQSVAATKTFICSLSAIAHLVAVWRQNTELMDALYALPKPLEKALACDWSMALKRLRPAANLFVVGRGLGLGTVREAALKFKEACGLHAEAFSAAEVKHGPMTLVTNAFPVLFFSTQDETQTSIDEVAKTFINRSAPVLSAGASYEGALNLETTPCANAILRPIVFIQSFYGFVNTLSLARGYNPDHPPYLSKVTETL
jgi:glutamine---fructose-6-phosphate transaminase (isomerizing)